LAVEEGLLPPEQAQEEEEQVLAHLKCALAEHELELLRENLRSQGERTCRYWLLRYRGDDLGTVEADTPEEAVQEAIDCVEVDAVGNMLDEGQENEEDE